MAMDFLNRLGAKKTWIWGIVLFCLLGWLDHVTGPQVSLVGVYFLVVAFIAWGSGRSSAVWASIMGALLWWSIDRADGTGFPAVFGIWNAFMRLVLFVVGGIACAELRRALNEKQKMINDLLQALNQVKTLSGMLPVCPCCRRVRVEQGSWENLETFVREKSQIEFVSSICPDCVEVEFDQKKTEDKSGKSH